MTRGEMLVFYAACIGAGLLSAWAVWRTIGWHLRHQEVRRQAGALPANDNHRLPRTIRSVARRDE